MGGIGSMMMLAAATFACTEGAGPTTRVQAAIQLVGAPPSGAPVGSEHTVSVRVVDADGAGIPGPLVTFAITRGGGSVAPASVVADNDGLASARLTVATTPGTSTLSIVVEGLDRFLVPVTSVAGAAATIAFSQPLLRLTPSIDSLILVETVRDAYGNVLPDDATWLARDPTLIGIGTRPQGGVILRVLRRPGETYVVATVGAARDSMRVAVQDASSSPCAFVADPVTLAVGETVRFDDDGITCVRADAAGAEYVVVVHHSSAVANSARTIGVVGNGIVAPAPFLSAVTAPAGRTSVGFEDRLRALEFRELAQRTVGARPVDRRANTSLPLNIPEPGSLRSFNVNADDFCENRSPRLFRAAAVSERVIVYADVANPSAGFSDAEYLDIARELDTLAVPVLESSFGSFSDIDYNGRMILLFTRAVNELPSPVALSSVLGFFFARDLLAPAGAPDACAGSNFGEMMYLMVPDPAGEISGTVVAKDFARRTTISTVAHETQHLINASRRRYGAAVRLPQEETWLNEGLSHVAEELVFHAASGSSPRQNVGGAQLAAGTPLRAAFDRYLRPNFERYRAHLVNPNGTSPLAANDLLGTRGAAWAFLRYVADQTRAEDGDFWSRLVNSPTTGASNLDAVLADAGLTTLQALENWALSVIADDIVPPERATAQQPSWNFRSAMAEIGAPLNFALAPATLLEGVTSLVGLINGGSDYVRFGVPVNQEALIRVSGLGVVPPGIHLTIMRIR